VPHDATRIRLVVLDWAGTAVDHGSRAPVMRGDAQKAHGASAHHQRLPETGNTA